MTLQIYYASAGVSAGAASPSFSAICLMTRAKLEIVSLLGELAENTCGSCSIVLRNCQCAGTVQKIGKAFAICALEREVHHGVLIYLVSHTSLAELFAELCILLNCQTSVVLRFHILGRQITLYALRHLLSSAWLITFRILSLTISFVKSRIYILAVILL